MPWYFHQEHHDEDEFIDMAQKCGIKPIIDAYRSVGLVFCYFEGPSNIIETGYNREPDFVRQPDLK